MPTKGEGQDGPSLPRPPSIKPTPSLRGPHRLERTLVGVAYGVRAVPTRLLRCFAPLLVLGQYLDCNAIVM